MGSVALRWFIGVGAFVGVALLLYWQFILAEGAYLGRRAVTLLYDLSAKVYDRIKGYDIGYEQWFLSRPLSSALFAFPDPIVLDVATGTARLARTLLPEISFRGRFIGLDLSHKMLEQAAAHTQQWAKRVTLIWQDATDLPFPDDTFEAVTCLEALEFMPDPDQVMREMVRVLRPGGLFVTTNRVGKDARWLPGRTYSEQAFEEKLRGLALEMVKTRPWQEDYDLVWAVKPGVCAPLRARRLEDVLRCPICHQALRRQDGRVWACANTHEFPTSPEGIIEMHAAGRGRRRK